MSSAPHSVPTARPLDAPGGPTVETEQLVAAVAEAHAATRRAFSASVIELCEAVDADPATILAQSGLTEPSSGDGVSCDRTMAASRPLAAIARSVGVEMPVVEAVRQADGQHLAWIANRVESRLGRAVAGLRVAIWGLTSSAIGMDLDSSPAARVVDLLIARGAEVAVYDPRLDLRCRHRFLAGAELCANALNACVGASALVVLEPWDGIEDIDLGRVAGLVSKPIVFDVRGVLDPSARRMVGL